MSYYVTDSDVSVVSDFDNSFKYESLKLKSTLLYNELRDLACDRENLLHKYEITLDDCQYIISRLYGYVNWEYLESDLTDQPISDCLEELDTIHNRKKP